jgi:glycosyltransferase involved in cell wall biosynthesis
MKILIFTTQFYQLGGAERLAVELAETLNHRGIHADILSQCTKDLPGVAEATEHLKSCGITAVLFLDLNVHPRFSSIPGAVRRLRQIVRDGQYDLVETSSLTPSLIAALTFCGMGVRHVMGIHDVFSRKRQCGLKYQIWRRLMRWNSNNRFYAISEYVRSSWIEYSATRTSRTRKVLNGITDRSFVLEPDRIGVRRELGVSESSRLFLFVGRLLKRKGIDTLLEAVGPILEQYDVYLLYVGNDAETPEGFFADEVGLMERLRSTLREEAWGWRVRFLGLRKDVPRLMAACDALIHPARIEGFGLVLAEALAAGLPVIASNVQGIPEVLAGTESVMVPPDDPIALREAVLKTLNRSPVESAQAIEKGRKRAESFRTSERTKQMIKLFEDVLSNKF